MAAKNHSSTTELSKKCESLGVDFTRSLLEILEIGDGPAADQPAISALEEFLLMAKTLNLDAIVKEHPSEAKRAEAMCDWFIDGVRVELERSVTAKAGCTKAPRNALAITDEIDRKLVQAAAIFKLMGEPHGVLPDDTLNNAAWAGRDLMKQAKGLVGELHAKAVQS